MQPLLNLEGGVVPSQGGIYAALALAELEVGVLECGRGEPTLQAKNVIRTIEIEVRPLELLRCLLVVLVHHINGAVEREGACEFP